MVLGPDGTVYGTASAAGAPPPFSGTLFRAPPPYSAQTAEIIYYFPAGFMPIGPLLADGGAVYGVIGKGGATEGAVYKIIP